MDADEEYRKSRLTKNMSVYVYLYMHAYKKRNDDYDGDYEILRHPFNDITFSGP